MSKLTYPKPTSFEQHPKLEPRRLLPIQPPPYVLLQSLPRPQPHSPIRASSSTPLHRYGYTYTTHLIPSAYPRQTPDIPEPTIPKDGETKEERKERVGRWTKELLELKWKQERGEVLGEGSREVLWNCLGRYVRNRSGNSGSEGGKGVTLFCAHANGMHKEASTFIILGCGPAVAFELPCGVCTNMFRRGSSSSALFSLISATNAHISFEYRRLSLCYPTFYLKSSQLQPTRLTKFGHGMQFNTETLPKSTLQSFVQYVCQGILPFPPTFRPSHPALHSNVVDWADNTRDILNFFINYLPEDSLPGSSDLPVHLERVPEPISQLRAKQGFADRRIICVGHSFGGASL